MIMERRLSICASAILSSFGLLFSACDKESAESDTPTPPTTVQADYEFTATMVSGTYYGNRYSAQSDQMNYSICLSDRTVSEDNIMGGNFYFFDIYGEEPADMEQVSVPEGTYKLGLSGTTEKGELNPDYTYTYFTVDGTTYEEDFTEGTLTVRNEGGETVCEALLTDTAGETHHVTWRGTMALPVDFGEQALDRDLDFTATSAVASYYYHYGDILEAGLEFTDMEITEAGEMVAPGSWIVVDFVQPYNEWNMIEDGTYPVKSTPDEAFTVIPGDSWYTSYAIYLDEYGTMFRDNITGGQMTIDMTGPESYTISCNFTTATGRTAKCTWQGYTEIEGMPEGGVLSTLTGDCTLDLSEIKGTANYFKNHYGTDGLEWMISLFPETGTGIQIQLVSESTDPHDGIASGTYHVNTDGKPGPGEWRDGLIDGSYYIGGTWLIGLQNGFADPSIAAPATDGSLEITNNGDGTYDISFAFEDDHEEPYVFSGEYHGELEIDYYTDAAAARPATAESASPQRQDMNRRFMQGTAERKARL